MRRKRARPRAARAKILEDQLRRAVRREARKAEGFLELGLDDLYAVLGAQVQAVQSASKLVKLKVPRGVDKAQAFVMSVALTREPPAAAGRAFLKRYWRNVLKNACKWWGENKDKFSGAALVSNLALAIAPALPPQLRAAASILAVIAVILISSGLDALCEERPENPPGVEEERPAEEVVEKPAEEVRVEEQPPAEEAPPSPEPSEEPTQPSFQ